MMSTPESAFSCSVGQPHVGRIDLFDRCLPEQQHICTAVCIDAPEARSPPAQRWAEVMKKGNTTAD